MSFSTRSGAGGGGGGGVERSNSYWSMSCIGARKVVSEVVQNVRKRVSGGVINACTVIGQ